MRWLFLIVLFLNLAYIAWQTTRPVTQSYENVQPLKNVNPIVLLSELKQQQAQVAVIAQTSALQNDEVNKPQQAPILAAANSEKQQPPPLPLQIVEAVEVVEVVETTETAPVKKSEEIKPPALTPDKDEVVIEKAIDIKLLKTLNELQKNPPQKERCFTLGPFRDMGDLRGLARQIKSYVVSTDFRGREEREQPLYWVYIQPEKNYKKAVATGKRLRAKKIKDFYVIREGEKIHGLSLGHFRNKNGAYRLSKKIKKLGFDVTVEPVFKTYTVYWLDYQLADGVNIPETVFERYSQSTKKGKVSRLSRSCGD